MQKLRDDMKITLVGTHQEKQQKLKQQPHHEKPSGSGLWQSSDLEESNCQFGVRPGGGSNGNEVANYIGIMNLERKKSPLAWWKTIDKRQFPLLFPIVYMFLSVPGTSAPCKRVEKFGCRLWSRLSKIAEHPTPKSAEVSLGRLRATELSLSLLRSAELSLGQLRSDFIVVEVVLLNSLAPVSF